LKSLSWICIQGTYLPFAGVSTLLRKNRHKKPENGKYFNSRPVKHIAKVLIPLKGVL